MGLTGTIAIEKLMNTFMNKTIVAPTLVHVNSIITSDEMGDLVSQELIGCPIANYDGLLCMK